MSGQKETPKALKSLNTWLKSTVHDHGKCYVARIDGTCSKYGFEREFVSFKNARGKWEVDPDTVSEGAIFELCWNGRKKYVQIEAVRRFGSGSKATKRVFDVEIDKREINSLL